SSSAQTSPSSTQSGVLTAAGTAFATFGKRALRSLPFRETSRASPACTYATARKPSHLTSNSQPSPFGTSLTSVASMTWYSVLRTGAAPSSRFLTSSQFFSSPERCAGTSDQRPSSREPCRRTVSPPSRFSSTSSYVPWSQISTVPAP